MMNSGIMKRSKTQAERLLDLDQRLRNEKYPDKAAYRTQPTVVNQQLDGLTTDK